MRQETVFHFDVLGFRHMAGGTARAAVEALSDLAELLRSPAIAQQTAQWSHRYSLSDSVFLTHPDPVQAVRQARDLVFTLAHADVTRAEPVLVRGALACGEIYHVPGIFLTSDEPANLVGEPVMEAILLEHASGLKGPRIFVSEHFMQTITITDHRFAEWQLRPTAASGVWEVLWLLPTDPDALYREEHAVQEVCQLALRLLKRNGGHREYGAQYRAFALLAGRCVERMEKWGRNGQVTLTLPLTEFLSVAAVKEICDTTTGLPDEYVTELLRLVESIGR